MEPLAGVNLNVEQIDGELAPLQIDPDDAEAMGLADETQSPGADPGLTDEEPRIQTSETKVRAMLKTLFFGGYMLHGEGHEHWLNNERELDEIVPGMTKLVNQFPLLAEAVEIGDTAAAPIKLFAVLAKNQIKSIRIKNQNAKAADPTQAVSQGGTDLYAGILK